MRDLGNHILDMKGSSILEGVADLERRYVDTGKVEKAVWDRLLHGDPSDTKKYLLWMIKQHLSGYDRTGHLVDMIRQFDKVVKKKKTKKADINQYKSVEDLEEELEKASKKQTRSERETKVKKDAEKVYEDENVVIIKPKSHAASQYYGSGTKWCISGRNETYWEEYYFMDSVTFYFVIDKKKKGRKFAVAAGPGGELQTFDDADNSIAFNDIARITGYKLPGREFEGVFAPATQRDLDSRDDVLIKRVADYLKMDGHENPDGTWDFDKSIDLSYENISKLPLRFGTVHGSFHCDYNRLTTLEGAPRRVDGEFNCSNNRLTSLRYCPKYVGEDFSCNRNALTSLNGAPSVVRGLFDCSDNSLTYLQYAPKRCEGGGFYCGGNQLMSLKGAPQEVDGSFMCDDNHLTTLEHCPKKISGSFNCSHNFLTSLEGAPEEIRGNFFCRHNKLTTLVGTPKEYVFHCICSDNHLVSLEGAPSWVGGDFDCSVNRLKSLKGGPSTVAGDFRCAGNKLKTLEGAPEDVQGEFVCHDNVIATPRLKRTVSKEYL